MVDILRKICVSRKGGGKGGDFWVDQRITIRFDVFFVISHSYGLVELAGAPPFFEKLFSLWRVDSDIVLCHMLMLVGLHNILPLNFLVFGFY